VTECHSMVVSKLLAVRSEVYFCSGFVPEIAGTNPSIAWTFVFFVCCVFLGSGRSDDLVIRSEESYRLCLYLCVIYEHQQTVILVLSLTTAPQKGSNIMFTDRHSKCSRRLLPAPRHCCFLSCRPFYRTNFRICCVVDKQNYLHGII